MRLIKCHLLVFLRLQLGRLIFESPIINNYNKKSPAGYLRLLIAAFLGDLLVGIFLRLVFLPQLAVGHSFLHKRFCQAIDLGLMASLELFLQLITPPAHSLGLCGILWQLLLWRYWCIQASTILVERLHHCNTVSKGCRLFTEDGWANSILLHNLIFGLDSSSPSSTRNFWLDFLDFLRRPLLATETTR